MGQFDLNSKDISFMVDAIGGILAENQFEGYNKFNEGIFATMGSVSKIFGEKK